MNKSGAERRNVNAARYLLEVFEKLSCLRRSRHQSITVPQFPQNQRIAAAGKLVGILKFLHRVIEHAFLLEGPRQTPVRMVEIRIDSQGILELFNCGVVLPVSVKTPAEGGSSNQ